MAEITFETFLLGLETTRGTAVSPTHLMTMGGQLDPKITRAMHKERRGARAKNYRSTDTRAWSEFNLEGDLDGYLLPVLAAMIVEGGVAVATPVGATDARLWEHTADMLSDSLKTATIFWGDPNLGTGQQLRSTFGFLEELTIEGDATSEDIVAMTAKGFAGRPTKVAAPSAITALEGPGFPGQLMQCWIDSGSDDIGTTELTDRLLTVKHTLRSGAKHKFIAKGPSHDLSFSKLGREQVAAVTSELTFEMEDFDEYDLWAAGTMLKVRTRFNAGLIEAGFYHYVDVDSYGPFTEPSWGEHENANRTMTVTIEGFVDADLGSDLRLAIQNDRATL